VILKIRIISPPFGAVIYPAEKRLRGALFIPDSAHAKDTKARPEMAGFFLLTSTKMVFRSIKTLPRPTPAESPPA